VHVFPATTLWFVAERVASLALLPWRRGRTIAAMATRAHDDGMSRRPHHVAMVAFPDAQILDVVGPLEVFSRAARVLSDEGRRGPAPYRVEVLARRAGPVVTSSSLAIVAARAAGVSPTAYRSRFAQ
jgi:hypothetical protein